MSGGIYGRVDGSMYSRLARTELAYHHFCCHILPANLESWSPSKPSAYLVRIWTSLLASPYPTVNRLFRFNDFSYKYLVFKFKLLFFCHRRRQSCHKPHKKGRPIAQAVSRWLPTAAARVRARIWSSGICGGQSGAGAGFLREFRFPLPIFIPPNSPSS
jgi:hypothetical protein